MSKYSSADSRNFGFWNEDEQDRLRHSIVSIAGVGGDGFQMGLKLAMMGVGEIRVADPEVFEKENSNRVLAATRDNIGVNKAEVFRSMVASLPRDIDVRVYSDGVNEANVEEFIHGSDLVIDESELRYLHVGTMIARTAIKYEVPSLMVMNVGFAGVATSFDPHNTAHGFQKLMGIPDQAPLDEVAEMEVKYSRYIPYIPGYGDLNTFKAVIAGAPLPSISPGVDAASAIGSTEAYLHLVRDVQNNRKSPIWAPRYRYMDAYTNKSGVIKYPRMSHYKGVAAIAIRSKLGLNPNASYGDLDRARRSEDKS